MKTLYGFNLIVGGLVTTASAALGLDCLTIVGWFGYTVANGALYYSKEV